MQRNTLLLILATLALAAAPLLAVPEPTAQELEQNRNDIERWRDNPEKYAALQQNAHAFLALPLERRKQIIQLDADLHEQPSAVQARLKNVLARYSDWLERLDAADRQRIRDAKDKQARLKIVQELREQEWFKRQPQKYHKDLALLKLPEERSKFVADLRQKERNRKRDWQVALRFWEEFQSGDPKKERLPASWSELNPTVRNYAEEYLKPLMLPEDWDRLMKTKGWPRFPQTLVELADKHPPALPPLTKGPVQISQLPEKIQKLIPPRPKKSTKKQDPLVRIYESVNSFPGFGQAVAHYLRVKPPKGPLEYEFLPNDADGLGKDAREFLDTKLMPLLSAKEQKDLARAAARGWLDYPRVLDELARNHHLQVPWQTLPGPRSYWDKYRLKKTALGFPALPDDVLRDFVRFELTAQERADLKVSLTEPETLQRAVPTFFQRRPHLQKQLRQVDEARRPRTPAPFVNVPAVKGGQPDS